MGKYVAASELILNNDGSIFHLHLLPQQLADKVILVGDPQRVTLVAQHFDTREVEVQNREFHTITGTYQGKRITVLSTGIGCDNVDIVVNELDALVNVDLERREVKEQTVQLDLVRIGTCGGLQPQTPEGTYVCSLYSIGFDGLLNFYADRDKVCNAEMEAAFLRHMAWTGHQCIAHPYAVAANAELSQRIAGSDMVGGITVSCGGFYAPQGRSVRLALADPELVDKVSNFCCGDLRITNFEMESSALAGLARMLGHRATTCCTVIANRVAQRAQTNYSDAMDRLIEIVLQRI